MNLDVLLTEAECSSWSVVP